MVLSETPNFGTPVIDPTWKIAIVRSVWYDELTATMAADTMTTLIAAGIPKENIRIIDSPGSYELPLLCKQALLSGADGCIALGIIVQGTTHHARLVAEQSASGAMQVQLELLKPVAYEVLFVNIEEDAKVRAIGKGAKGPLAAKTLLTSLARLHELR